MNVKLLNLIFLTSLIGFVKYVRTNEVLGCGGFVKSHVPIDFSKVEIKLVTKQGIIKDKTNCAPNNGYYFIPLYDKGELILELSPPPGWSFTPNRVELNVDGTDPCSLGKDINFNFGGFGITGKVESLGSTTGPSGVNVQLKSNDLRSTVTNDYGSFLFTPVFPGTYTITISHPKWKTYKNTLTVQVTEGNTELPPKSLIVQGYDVKGKVSSEGVPVKETTILLFSMDGSQNILVDGCNKNEPPGVQFKNKILCHVKSDASGQFTFGVIPNGNYYILPYYKDKNIYFQPEKIEFSINHNSVELNESFEVIGFSLPGRVIRGKNNPISDVKIFLNGQEVAKTNPNGEYKLEKLKIGNYKLRAEADDVIFEETLIKIHPDSRVLPDIMPSAFKVCGSVTSDKPQLITFSQVGSTKFVQTETVSEGHFCQYLSPGKYEVQVNVNEEDKKKGLQFFPIKQVIEVTSERVSDILFSQLKADVSGKVQCIRAQDCDGLNVVLKSNFEEITMPLKGDSYSSSNVQPGSYEVSITSNKLCWKSNKQVINVNSATVIIPPFVQSGYSVNFISSHDAKLSFNTPGQNKKSKFDILRGITLLCLEKPGEYSFLLESCHKYEQNPVIYNTDSPSNEVIITAQKHTTKLSIQSNINFGNIEVTAQTGREKFDKTLQFDNQKYVLDLMLEPSELAIITPRSDVLYFSPQSVQIQGGDDCEDLGVKFKAIKGKVFEGKIIPPLDGVLITVEGGDDEKLTIETDEKGVYKFPPLNDNEKYKITAEKENYVISGPDNSGNFKAHKLAEIVVEVVDEADKSPLQGVLLSLSGDESYRKNLQTNEDGKISFHSLSPSEYFLRPMMKEYQFSPNSKIIKIEEGETVNVRLVGKKVAYSAYGKVTTLNGESSSTMVVIASGINNCSQYSEEATTDALGQFRIRGLQPYCSYRIFVKLDENQNVERTAPEFIELTNINKDETDLNIVVFNPIAVTDILVKVFTENVEHYRSMKVQLYRENPNPSLIYSTSIDNSVGRVKEKNNGVLVHIPAIALDNKLYSLQLSSNIKHNSDIHYFNANSSFKYVELYFSAKNNTTDQNIKQTPVWTLIFVFTLLGGAYNLQLILDLLKDKFNFNINGLGNFIPVQSSNKTVTDSYYDNAQIEQIVQSINNLKKRPKPKKTN